MKEITQQESLVVHGGTLYPAVIIASGVVGAVGGYFAGESIAQRVDVAQNGILIASTIIGAGVGVLAGVGAIAASELYQTILLGGLGSGFD